MVTIKPIKVYKDASHSLLYAVLFNFTLLILMKMVYKGLPIKNISNSKGRGVRIKKCNKIKPIKGRKDKQHSLLYSILLNFTLFSLMKMVYKGGVHKRLQQLREVGQVWQLVRMQNKHCWNFKAMGIHLPHNIRILKIKSKKNFFCALTFLR